MDAKNPRPLPATKAFYYAYAAAPYQIKLAMDDIVPSFDVVYRLLINVKEDDLIIDANGYFAP